MNNMNRFSLNVLLLPIATLLLAVTIQAQNYDISFDRVSIEDGLSQSSIQDIAQDDQGFLWFGTQDGLNKFDGYSFKIFRHDPEDSTSLSDDWIISIEKDVSGNLWILTNAGSLNRFNVQTEQSTRYAAGAGQFGRKITTRIISIYADSDGFVWLGTDGDGLFRLNVESLEIDKIAVIPDEFRASAFMVDTKKHVWVGGQDNGLFKLTANESSWKAEKYNYDETLTSSLSSDFILSLFEDSRLNIWVGTQNGLNLFDENKNTFTRFQNDQNNPLSIGDNMIYDIFEDKYGQLWVATNAGLSIRNRKMGAFLKIRNSTSNPWSLSNDLTRRIFQDASGTLWIGTYGGGLNHFEWSKSQFGHYKNIIGDPNSLTDNNVWSLLLDRKDNLWVATGKGINRFYGKTNKLRVYKHNPLDSLSISDDLVRVIYEDRSGILWFGTNSGGLNRFNPATHSFTRYMHDPANPATIAHNTIRAIYEDKDGFLWLGTWDGLDRFNPRTEKFTHYKPVEGDSTSISDNRVRCINQTADGTFWVGTYGGLNKFDPQTGAFTHFVHDPNNPNSISHDRLMEIYPDSNSGLWIGTYGGGLNYFDPETGLFSHYTEEDGLANNAVYGILSDAKGNLWMSTNKGLSCFDPHKKEFKNYDVNDGLQSNEFNGGASFKSAEGEFFFGGINGLNRFFPERITENRYIPPIVLTSFRIFGDEVQTDTSISHLNELRLSYKQNFFEISFASLDYSNPDKNQYMYMLEGIDAGWIDCGNRRYANYTNLDGGEYRFYVRGTNSDGLWNTSGASLNIIITPPFWQTWWFRILISVFLLGVVLVSYKMRVSKIERQKRFLEAEVAARTEEIKERNTDLRKAKKETDAILNNVEEGILLLNSELEIKSQHSRALNQIFEQKNLGGRNFIGLLEKKVPDKITEDVREYLSLMFNDEIDESTLTPLNPLSEIEFTFNDGNGSAQSIKHLSFQFRRISRGEKTQELIGTVVDITDQVLLSQQLEASQERSKKQLDWLLSLLHVEPNLLKEFIQSAYLELNYIETMLKHNREDTEFSVLLEKIYRSIHLLKGNASLLDLQFFVEQSHEFEDYISHIREKDSISGSDFVPVVLKLTDLRGTLNELKNMINRISRIHTHFRPKRTYENKVFIQSLNNLVKNLSGDLTKEVVFIHDDFEISDIPYNFRLTTREILIQMIRNAIYHGIENSEERIIKGKSPGGVIEVKTVHENNLVGFSIRDDGQGIQIDRLRSRLKNDPAYKSKIIDDMPDHEVIQKIYETGVSTLEKANYVAGRGVGLDIVKDKIEKVKGKISLKFEQDKYCEFTILFPVGKTSSPAKIKRQENVIGI